MKVLVTGGSGSVGKYVVDELVRHKHDVGVLDIVPPRPGIWHHDVDVLDLPNVVKAVKGYDAVVHMAGIPHPLNHPPEKVFGLNVNGTFNVLEAAARTGVMKVIFTSSESTLGFAFMSKHMAPDYIPIDETHPLRPQDPYGLSKIIGERICQSYSERYGIRTVCLREPWIWVPEGGERERYKGLIAEPHKWCNNLWAFVHAYDAAQAHRLAVEKDLTSMHEIFFITAKDNWTGMDSRSLMRTYFPEVKGFAPDFAGASSLLSCRKAYELLGYIPQYTVRDILF
jgi:UDP-glucose 4-epimerase